MKSVKHTFYTFHTIISSFGDARKLTGYSPFTKKRDSILLTLGNLAIIPQALNASIRDAAWNVKKIGKGQNKPGLLLCASGLCTLHNVLQKNIWDESEIENRADWLLTQAKNIWKI